MAACSCGSPSTPFGYSSCVDIAQRAVGFGFQSIKNDAGGNNEFASIPLTQALWDAAIYSNDDSVRVELLKNVKTVTDERADPEFEELDGISYVTAEGQRYISFEVIGAPNKLKTYVDALRCGVNGFYMISAGNELVGDLDTDNSSVRPIPMEKGTLYTKIIGTTRTTQQKLMVKFMVAESFDDADMGMIPSDDVSADLKATPSQIGVSLSSVIVASATTITLDATYKLNNVITPEPYVGAAGTDFDLYNVTTASTVTVTPTEPVTDGTYVLTFAPQTIADVLELRDADGSVISYATVTGLVAL